MCRDFGRETTEKRREAKREEKISCESVVMKKRQDLSGGTDQRKQLVCDIQDPSMDLQGTKAKASCSFEVFVC